jgi:hypothetical protein
VNFSDANLPSRVPSLPTTETFPVAASFTSSMNAINPNLKIGYVQSWNLSFQRELDKNTVMDIRYNGNHGTDLWRQYNLNEVNIFENGFLNEFKIAQNNLAIARGGNLYGNQSIINFGNTGLPGQQNTPILSAALGTTSDSTTATSLMNGQAGTVAGAISGNAARMSNLRAAGYPANFFVVNPDVAGSGGGAFVLTNDGASFYDALQVEVRRRMASGFTIQGSYVWSKALARGATASTSDSSQPNTLRNLGLDKLPEGFDIRQAVKFNWIYELPFGPGKHFAPSNVVAKKIVEGWQISGVARFQSGTPLTISSFATYNQNGSGVVLHNITMKQLQSEVGVYKTSLPGANGGTIYYLPPPTSTSVTGLNSSNNTNLIFNTEAAFNQNSLLPSQVNPNAPYISPAAAGQAGCLCYIYLPWQRHLDLELQKNTRITERVQLQIAVSALDALNLTNFLPGSNIGSSFGQITTAYRDISGTVDPGARIIEFRVRLNF